MKMPEIELENGVKLQLETNKVISGPWDKREITVQLKITPTPKELGKFTCVVISDNSVMIQINKVVKS